jgi:hypothetical protein
MYANFLVLCYFEMMKSRTVAVIVDEGEVTSPGMCLSLFCVLGCLNTSLTLFSNGFFEIVLSSDYNH